MMGASAKQTGLGGPEGLEPQSRLHAAHAIPSAGNILRDRLLEALTFVPEDGRSKIPLEEMLDNIIFALDCDPGHDATSVIVEPCEDRDVAVYTYRSIIRSALAEPDGGSAF
jgi:hypothetical protein